MYFNNVSLDNGNAAGRSWTYQTCTEFGYFQTGSASDQPFSDAISLQWYIDQVSINEYESKNR